MNEMPISIVKTNIINFCRINKKKCNSAANLWFISGKFKRIKHKNLFYKNLTSQNKGSIVNRNGVIRRFYPKKTDFNKVSSKDEKKAETKINNRPVKRFGYKTPSEVYLLKAKVALIA